jgi:hypothetical protein
VSATTDTLMAVLDQNLVGFQVERGGALHAKPSEEVRRRIRVFKRLEAEHDYEGDGFGDIEEDLAEIATEFDREETLMRLFAAGRKNVSDSKRPKGFAPWRPQRKTLVVLAQVKDILDEYRAELPLTARQIFYRLVGAYGFPKNENAYERLTNILVRARRSGRVPFESIRDDGASVLACTHYEDKEDFYKHVRELGENWTKNKLTNQGVDVRIYCEAAGMMPQIARVSHRYSVPVYSCSGFDSLTSKYDLAQDVSRALTYKGRHTVVLHLGDHDPSGESMFSDGLVEDVHAFVSSIIPHKDPSDVVVFKRVALTAEQATSYSLEPAPAKTTDSRSKKWGAKPTYQLEALPPDVLAGMVDAEITALFNREIFEADVAAQPGMRRTIAMQLPGADGAA